MSSNRPHYSVAAFLRDEAVCILLALACAASIAAAVKVLGCPIQAAALLGCTVLLFAAASLAITYLRKRGFYHEAEDIIANEASAYYLPDVIKRPRFIEGQLLYDACNDVAKADAALLTEERAAAAKSREYVELWTHEVKTPIAASRLTLSHMHGVDALALKQEIERIEVACERALYSSRVTTLARDYAIREVTLEKLCKDACRDLANILIQSKVHPVFELDGCKPVLADEQWTRFVVKQIVSNSAKYQASKVMFSVEVIGRNTPHGRVDLTIADDGCGIAAEELPSIFERGFSGSNGRMEGKSTGMGLYLAAEVCRAMGVGLSATSAVREGTTMTLSFPLDLSRL